MSAAIATLNVAIGVLLAWAGIAKLRGGGTAATTLVALGVPGRLAAVLGVVLPVAEIALAVAFVALGNAAWLCWLLAGLVVAFTVVLLLARRAGVPCACFGVTEVAEPPGIWEFARNIVLLALSLALGLLGQQVSPVAWCLSLPIGERVVLLVALGSLALAGVALAAANGSLVLHDRLADEAERIRGGDPKRPPWFDQGLPVGSPAPAMRMQAVQSGEHFELDDERDQRPRLLLFVGSGCSACRELAGNLASRVGALEPVLAIVEVHRLGQRIGLPGVEYEVADEGGDLSRRFQARATPAAVLVETDGLIGSPCARGLAQVNELIDLISERMGVG